MAEDNDILGMIAALEAKRAALDNAIASLRVLAGQGGSEALGGVVAGPRSISGEVRSDSFHGLSMPEAVKRYLRISKVPQSAKAIADVLPKGGFKTKAKNLYANVYTALLRLQENGEAEKLASGEWGLSEWYRGGSPKKPERHAKEPESEAPATSDAAKAASGSDPA